MIPEIDTPAHCASVCVADALRHRPEPEAEQFLARRPTSELRGAFGDPDLVLFLAGLRDCRRARGLLLVALHPGQAGAGGTGPDR